MEFIKKLRNIIIVLTLVTIMIIATSPITVLGASDKNVPVITAYQNGGQLKPGQEIKFKIKDDTKISYIFYAWDRRTQGNGYETFKLPNEQSEYEYTVKAPMTTGLHEFSIAAQDQYGNISYWLNIPYTIVNEVSEVVDNTKPTLIFDTENGKYPYHESTISQEMPITLQAQDDSGIYYIAYKWTREIVQNDTGATLVFNKTNSKSFTTEITAPVESGDWFLLVYARDGANNVSNTYATKVTIKATDYTKLKEKLDSIKNTLIESDYENFEELQNAIAEANNMISQNKSSQKTVDAQLTKIESAIKNLQAKAVNRQELDNYINSLVSTDYKNWAELQRLITDAQDKSVTLQSEFNKRLQKVKEFSLEAKEIDTSKLDTLKQELAKLDKNDYTEKSWNEIQTKISNAEQQTLQSKFDKIVNEISLEILVKLPKITNVSSNPKYVAAESQVTISFETNMELNIESSTASINGKAILGKIEKVEENKYKFTYTVTSDDEVKGSISYAIKPVADNKGEEVEGKEVTGEISIADYITGIEITRPTKLQYEVDDIEMDLSEGKVTPIMASGKPQEAVDMNIEMISGFDTSSDGTKTITVTYKEQTATFEIQVLKKEISKNEFTLSSLEVDYDGTEKTVEITPTDGVGAVTEVKYYPIISEHEQEALEGKPVNAGKYAVKVSVKEGRKYKAINDFSIGTLTILQATPEYEVPKGLTAIYGKKLKDIQLPDKFTFQDDQETEVGTVGEHTFKVKYTPEDIKNYKIIENIDVIVTVIKAVPEYTAPQGLTAIYGQTLEDVKITDSKFKFQDELTTPVGDVGENTFLVTYTPEDTHNYEIVRDIEVTITVLKASAPEIIYPTSTPIIYGQKLENSELVGGSIEYGTFAWQSSSFVPPAGTNNYIVIFTPNENTIKNYEEISVKQREIAIEVEKATYDMSDVKFEGSTITYDGNSHNIKITGKLPEGVTVQYEGNNKRDVGEYTVIAKFTGGEDKENYNEIPNMQATLKITPRTPAKEDLKYTIKSTEYSGKTQGIEVTANDGIQGLGEITVKYNGNIDKPVNVGKYKVTVTIGEGTNYSATEQDIELGEYEITRKAPSKEDLSYSITSTEYTGKAQGIKVTAKDGIKGLGTITVKYNGSTDEPINAGTYKITVSIAEGTNYSATEQDIELENYIITAKTPSKEDLEYNLESKEYTGEEQEIEVTAKEGINGIGTITVKYDDSNNKPKDAKVYTVTVDIAEGTNYSSAQSIELGTFEITKKAPSKEDLKFDLTSKEYTGVEQEVEVTAEEGIEGLGKTITVKYDGDTKKPVNAGTYAITVDIDEGTNYSSVEGLELGDFTITPSKTPLQENNFEIEGETNVEYDGQQHTIEVKAKDVVLLGTIKVSYYNDSNGEEVEAPTNVGTYTIKVTTEGATNYADVEDLELTTKLEITAVAITVKVDDITAVYGEDKKELTCSKEVTSGTLVGNDQVTDLGIELKTYYNEREEEIEIGPKTPVGTYKIKGENTVYGNYNVTVQEGTYTITRKTPSGEDLSYDLTDKEYTGKEQELKVTAREGIEGLGTGITVKYNGSESKPKDVGEYEITVDITEGTNYSSVEGLELGTLKITKKVPTQEELKHGLPASKVYNGEARPITVTAKEGIKGLGKITIKYNGEKTEPIDAKEYTVTVDIEEGKNYSSAEDIQIGIYTITPATPTAKDLKFNLTSKQYTGEEQGVEVTAGEGIKGLGTITVKYDGFTEKPVNVGKYTVTVDIAEGTNYSSAESIELGTFEITRKAPSKEDLKYNLESKEYTGEEQEVEVTAKEGINGIGTITVKYDDSNNKPKDVKVYTVTVDIAEGTNYSSAQSIELGTFEITKKAPSKEDLKFDLTSKEYTGVEQEVEVTAEEGIEGLGKTITVKYDGDTKKPVNAGTYAITVDIDEGTNYSSVEGLELGDFTITPSKTQLEENNFEIEGKTNVEYDGQQHTVKVKAKDVVLLGTITVKYYDSNGEEVEAPTNVGTYTIKVTTEGATNYADVEDLELTTKLEITAVAITVKVDDITAVYGEDKKELTCSKEVTSGALVGNDQVTDLGIELKTYYNEREEEIEIGPKTPVGTYKIKGESTVYGNYNVTVQDGTYTIEAKEITVKADDKTATYGDKAQQLTFSEVIETEGKTALVNGEKLSILKIELKTYKKAEPDQEQTISETTSVGTYNIKANSKIYGNYNVTVQNGTYTIEAKAITVKADDKESSYGEPAQELTYSEVTDVEGTTSLVNGENLKTALGITLKTYKNEEELQISETTNAGTYAIKGDNGVYGNYNVTVQDGTYTITPSKTQLEENNFEIEGKTNVEYDGQQHTIEVKAKDVVLLGTIKVSYYNDSNGEEVEAPTNVGTYTIKVTTEGATNYADVEDLELTTKLEITAVAITVKADDITAVYGEDKKELTCSKEVISGTLVGDDQVTDLGIELKTYYNEREEEIEIGPKTPVGTYKIKGESTAYGNYNVTVQEGTYTITRKTPSGEDLSYDLTDKEYTGKEQEVQVTAREETEGLGTGITVKYNESEDKPKAVGNYNVTVDITEGTNYSAVNGLELGTLKITRKTPTINELQYNLPTSNTYNGKAIPIEVTAKEGVEGLGKITIKYNGESTEPIDAKEYTVTVDISEGDNYSSVTDIELGKYTITQASIEKAEVTTLVEDIVYDGQEKEQKVTSVKLNEVSLIKDSDYTLTITYATYSIEEHKVTSDFTTNKPLDVGTYSVKILVEGIGNYTGSKTAEAIMEIKPIEVDSISITTQPSKLEYRYGETIVTDGGKLEVTYNNKKKETIDITTDMIQGELKSATTLGTQNVTIEYEGQTANYDITVKDYITKIEAKPSKIVYKVGEVFEKDTLEVKVYKASKEGEGDVVLVTDEMLSECNFAVEGQKTITVSYIDNDEQSATKGQVFTATFEIAVVPNETDQQYAMVLNGSSEVHIEVTPENANSYKDEGVTVYKVDDSTSPVEGIVVKTKITALDNGNLEASIDTTKLGKYKITYSTNNADDVTRIVYIEDTTAPVINLNKDIVSNENVDISEEENNNINIKFTREKATFDLDILVSATDNYDTPKNKEIEIIYTVQYNDSELKDIYEIGKETEPGVYVVNYTATDSSGNMSTKSITFTILDYPPTIYYLEELDAETVIKVQLKNGNVYNRYLKIGCDTENVTIRIRVDGKEENDYNGEILKDGTYTVKVVQNEYINSEEITFTIDTIPPKVSVNEETRTITFEDPSDVYKATLTTGDGKTTITIKDGEGNNNIKEDGTYHIDGTGIMVYTLNVEDKYGNAITPIEFILLK